MLEQEMDGRIHEKVKVKVFPKKKIKSTESYVLLLSVE